MKTLNLRHSESALVNREDLARIATPSPDGRWHPIPHISLLDGVSGALERSGLKVVQEVHAVAREGQRYFGMMQLTNGHNSDDYGLIVGLRNAHDKATVAGLVVGSGVFVCDNLAFSGEIVIGRKHTTNITRDLPGLIEGAVGRIADVRGHQDRRIAAYRSTELGDAQVHDLLIQAVDSRVMANARIPAVLQEWRSPRYPEFRDAGRTAWRLFNGFTEALKDTSMFDRPRATQALHGLLDTVCHVN